MSETITTILIVCGVCLLIYGIVRGCVVFLCKGIKGLNAQNKEPPAAQNSAMESQKQAAQAKPATNVIAVILFGGLLWYLLGGGLEQHAAKNMRDIQSQVAADSVAQYDIAKRNGTAMDRCVQAGLVTAAFLQAQDEANYQTWKQVEQSDCAHAGLAR